MSGMQDPNANSAMEWGNEQNEKEIVLDRLIIGASRMGCGVNKSKISGINERIRAEIIEMHQMFTEKAIESLKVAAQNAHLRVSVLAQMNEISGIAKEFHVKSCNLIIDMEKANERIARLSDWWEGLVPELKELPFDDRKYLVCKFKDAEKHMLSWALKFEGFENDLDDMKGKAMEDADPCIKVLAILIKQGNVSA